MFEEVRATLSEIPRRLPPKLFYDERGARLFEKITQLDEYYLTRTELGILEEALPEVRTLVGPGARVVEFGSGSGKKTWKLLDALERPATMVPIDIAEGQLHAFADRIRAEHPEMEVVPLAADFTQPYTLPPSIHEVGTTLVFFPGSTIGNFEPDEAIRFLSHMARAGGDRLLLGVDMRKSPEILEPAYNDPEGVTAEFNRNALRNLNRTLGANFDPEGFRHHAPWNPEASRIEMHLIARRPMTVTIPGPAPFHLSLKRDEIIVTEHSYKYTRSRILEMCRAAGWEGQSLWTDVRGWFEVHWLVRSPVRSETL